MYSSLLPQTYVQITSKCLQALCLGHWKDHQQCLNLCLDTADFLKVFFTGGHLLDISENETLQRFASELSSIQRHS